MIWVIAGTLDGRTLAVDIQERTGEDVLVTVVSQYGAELAAIKALLYIRAALTNRLCRT